MKQTIYAAWLALSIATGGPAAAQGLEDPIPEPIPRGDINIVLADVASEFTAPNWGIASPADVTRLFVVDQVGILWAVDLNTGVKAEFLDISDRVVSGGERGFLGLAFHPNYALNGLFYTYTSEPAGEPADFSTLAAGTAADHQSVITEWRVAEPLDPAALPDPASARVLLRIDQPQGNHNGGALNFDNVGRLYIALGDGGSADDQGVGHGDSGNGQDLGNPLGALLRIDPLGSNSANGRYGVPPDNPFFGQPGQVGEIYAYGFRNPFRFSFDPLTGMLWLGDVGQNDIEEIDLVTAGGNYGWNFKEGSFFFDPNGDDPGFVTDVDPGVPAGLIDPVAEYDHDEGNAVIGGFVYRGARIPELRGRYVFGDFRGGEGGAGRLFYLTEDNEIREFNFEMPAGLEAAINGFGRDGSGELYVLGNVGSGEDSGVLLRIDPAPRDLPASGGGGGGGCSMLRGGTDPLLPLLLALAGLYLWRQRAR